MSHSELYVRAISIYVEVHKNQKVTDLLNEVYAEVENQEVKKEFKQGQRCRKGGSRSRPMAACAMTLMESLMSRGQG